MEEKKSSFNKLSDGILVVLFAPILMIIGFFAWGFYANFKASRREIDRMEDDIRLINKC